jgi:hypothetical protein
MPSQSRRSLRPSHWPPLSAFFGIVGMTKSASRATLVTERQQAAERLADLKVRQATVGAQHARVTAEAGPALYLAKLFGSNDTEAIVRLITALLVLPLAVLLTLAAARDNRAVQ